MSASAEGAPAVGQTLRRIAQELREHPERWTKGCYSRNAAGEEIGMNAEGAASHCAEAFLFLNFDDDYLKEAYGHLTACARELAGRTVVGFNDHVAKDAADVADLFDAAAARAELQP